MSEIGKVQPFNTPAQKEVSDADAKDVGKLELDADALQNGPVMQRSCTDCICCLVFVAFVLGMSATAAYGFAKGDPKLLLTTWDADGNGCGYSPKTLNYPYLYWPAPNFAINTSSTDPQDYLAVFKYSMCVSSCPSNNTNTTVNCSIPGNFSNYAPDKFINCTYFPAGAKVPSLALRYNTELLMNRYCVPDASALLNSSIAGIAQFKQNFFGSVDVDQFSNYINDLQKAWYVMAIAIGVAVVVSIIFLLVLRCCAGVMIWICILAILGGLGAGGYWLMYTRLLYDPTSNTYKYMQYGAYAVWGVDGLFALIVLCCCSRIRLAVAVMKVTSSFMYRTPTIILLPIFFIILCAAWIVGWTFLAVYIMSVGTIGHREAPLQFMTTVIWTQQTRYIFLYHLFGGLLVNAFLIGCFQFIVAAACAIWYFSHTSDTAGKGSVCTGIKWILVYHLGSIAFGSFIIALVQFIRLIFEYYSQKIQAANKDNPVVKFMLCCTSYLLACLERCIKFITKNAYIQIALTSKNFCRSAWNAFLLIVKNAFRFGAVTSVGAIFMFLGQVFIIVVTTGSAYLMMTKWPQVVSSTSSPYFPCIVAVFIGYLIGAIFMSVFGFASDTILQCFLLDEELGSAGKGRPPGNRPPLMNDFIAKATGTGGGCCG